jgi:hypothetical protein
MLEELLFRLRKKMMEACQFTPIVALSEEQLKEWNGIQERMHRLVNEIELEKAKKVLFWLQIKAKCPETQIPDTIKIENGWVLGYTEPKQSRHGDSNENLFG